MNPRLKEAVKVLKDMPYSDEFRKARHTILLALNEYESALDAIKTGVYFVQEKSYGDYQKKTIKNLKEAQEYAASILKDG